MTELEAIQEFEDYAYHRSLKQDISPESVAMAISALQAQQNGGWISVNDKAARGWS